MEKLKLLPLQDSFLSSLETNGKSFNTLKNYRTDLNIYNQFLTSKGRDLILNEMTLKETQEYGQFLEKKYNSPNSIRRRIQALRIFFDYLIANNKFDSNPIKKMLVSPKVVDIPRPTPFHIVKKLAQVYTEQVENTKGHEKLLHLRNLTLIKMIYGGAFKVSDLERIKQPHIFDKKGIRVLVAPEKKDPYTVKIEGSFEQTYQAYLELLEKRKNTDKIDFDNFFFNANPFKILKGGLSARGIEIVFKEFSRVVDFQVTAKSLRQACIIRWLIQDVSASRIKEWMNVQPQYSLAPYQALLKDEPHNHPYIEI